jgi:lipid A disaccharide synthetase
LIGRISGKYLPGDPLSYRIKYENANNPRHEKSDPIQTQTGSYAPNSRQNEIDGKNADFNNSMYSMKTATNPLDYLLHLNTLIQLQDKKHREFLQKRKIENNLEDIANAS